MKSKRERLEELTGKKLPWASSPIFEAFEYLNVPEEVLQRMLGISPHKAILIRKVSAFIIAKELDHEDLIKKTAVGIGAHVTSQILKGNYDAPRAVSEALLQMQSGGTLEANTGRKASLRERILIVMAYYLIEKTGCKRPSQADVRAALVMMECPMRRDRVSKIFEELGLRKVANDARLAVHR
jgi:hypothetical protein